MPNQTTYMRCFGDGFLGRALSVVARQPAIFYTLLLALFLSGTVPQAYMRTAGDDGMMLVLCTPDGPTEVWLSSDGAIQDEHSPPQVSDCLAVTLSLVLVQSWIDTLAQPAEFSPNRATFIDPRSALVPTQTPLQPRAPPAVI